MNCSRFRFFIQQRFDVDIAPQEERAVSAHLESCESCAKFHHQLQQVIMAAEEVPLPDEMKPNPPEALARQIMEGLPQAKASPFDFFTKLFAKKEKELPTTIDRGGSKFPHRSSSSGANDFDAAPGRKEMAMPTQSRGGKKEEDHSGTSNRLRALSKGSNASIEREGREAQSTTRSLGEKMGFAAPPGGSLTDDQPLTLAESIRRKVSETKPADGSEQDFEEAAPPPTPQGNFDDGWGPGPSSNRPPANMAAPPSVPRALPGGGTPVENGQTVLGTWGKPSPIENGNSWGGQSSAPAQSGDDWNFDGSGAAAAQQMGVQPGGIDPFATHQPGANSPAPAGESWGGWDSAPRGATPADADSDWGPPPQGGTWDEPANASSSNSWGGTPNPIPNASAQPQPKPQPQFNNSSVMETGMIKLGELGLPSMNQPNAGITPGAAPGILPGGAPGLAPGITPGGAPGMPSGIANGGAPGMTPGAQPAQAPAFGQPNTGTTADTNTPGGWGAAPVQGGSPGGASADPWGSSSDSWGAVPAQNAWGSQETPSAESQGGADSWGNVPGQNNWNNAPAAEANWDNGAPSAQQPTQGGAAAAWGDNDWGRNDPQAPQQNAEPTQTSSQAAALGKGRQQAWSLEAEQVETGTWRAFAPSGETLSGSAPAQRATPGQPGQQSFAPAQEEQSRWDIPIQERMKQQQQSDTNLPKITPGPTNTPASPFAQPAPSLGQQPAAFGQPPAFNQQPAAFGQQPAAFGQPAPGAPPQPQPQRLESVGLPESPAPTKSGWNFPVYEAPDQLTNVSNEATASGSWDKPAQASPSASTPGLAGAWGDSSTATAPEKITGGWDMPSIPSFPPQPMQPAAAAPLPGQPGGLPVDSIMDRLGNVLANNEGGATGAATQAPSPWDVSIQERQKQQQQQPAANSPWGQTPEPAAPQQSAAPSPNPWSASPAAASVPAVPAPSAFAPSQPASNAWESPAPSAAPAATGWDNPSSGGWGEQPTTPAAGGWDNPAMPAATPSPGAWDNQPGKAASPWGQTASTAPDQGGWEMPGNAPAPTVVPAPALAPQPAAAAGLFQNLDDQAIDRLFSENLGVNDQGSTGTGPNAGAAPAVAPAQAAAQATFSTPRWNPENNQAAPPAPSFGGGMAGAAPVAASTSPFAPPQPVGSDQGAPIISAITPRGTAETAAPRAPGMDRRQSGFDIPAPGPSPAQPMSPFSAPVEAPAVVPQPAAAAAPIPSSKNGLFNLDDSAMDELFSKNLGVNESATPSNSAPAPAAPVNAPVFQSPPPAMAQQQAVPPANPFSRPAPNQAQAPVVSQPTPAAAMPNPFAQMTAPPAQPGAIGAQPPQPSWGQQPPAPLPAPAAAPAQGTGGLFSIDDSMIDKIFADNAPVPAATAAAAAPQFNVNEAVKEVAQYTEMAQVPPPKIAGVGRLDPRTDSSNDSGSGRIASIGKFLLDQKDLEKIGKMTGSDLTETKMRILTMEAAQELQTLLHHIGTQETVVGSVIVGHDGLPIANTMPPDIDAESIGVWALGLYMSTEMVIKKMGQDRVHQIVSRTPKGYVVIADFGGGLLVTVSDGKDTDTLIPLMRSITQLVAQ